MRKTMLPLAAALLACAALATPGLAQPTVTVVDYGGTWQAAESKALFQPIAKKLGVTLREDSLQTIADIRLQVQSGKPTWDVVALGIGECLAAAKEGLFEPVDYSVVTNAADFPPELRGPNYVPGTVWASFVLTWSKEKFKNGGPQSWADYFDTKKFPGARAAYNAPRFMLEAALLADGVAKDKVYPIDIDRAFAKIRAFRKDVAVWYTSFGQAVDLINAGEVDVVPVLDGRIIDAIAKGAKWDFTFNQGIINAACSAIVKGAPNKATAMKFLNEMLDPELQANLTNYFVYGPMSPKVYATGLIKPEVAVKLNSYPANFKMQVVLDPHWWADNRVPVQSRWDAMMKE
ncbi:ABC transporter substrate-binding protein [Limobrevibacterium gyesilva]|uniref:ABC transporter substrate-binding protein n=1 Tax=Limobrevibacterium gyesilva TaxID=2991712 RepID=A0AA41YNE7_9PROT|nr:ABC transporter substrate-binding protein [Limobrevibacterium gyesilva]MCW3477096.1 ABC transporter substrate-binding protein [Limobrevibacterium gyesilva]